jgi:membrane-associated phospholipid phosphatase
MMFMRAPALVIVLFVLGISFVPFGTGLCQSPYRLDTSREVVLLTSGLAEGVAAILVHGTIDPLTSEQIAGLSSLEVNRFDRSAISRYSSTAGTASDILVAGLAVAPVALLFDRRIQDDWKTYALMYGETMLLTGVTVQLVKVIVTRTRPFAYNPEVPIENKTSVDTRLSFYSGHTTLAFASAVFLSVTYAAYRPESAWRPWVWAGSLSLASLVGYFRYASGQHFPTDVLMGAAIGATIGYLVPFLHQVTTDISISPETGIHTTQLCIVVHF